jgi:hypothetical protein
MRRILVLCLAAASALGLAACGDDDGGEVRTEGTAAASGPSAGSGSGSGSASQAAPTCESIGDPRDATTTANATLTEFEVTLDKNSAPAGNVHFVLDNKGADPHEFVVVKDTVLPTKADGSLDEDKLAPGVLIGEVEPFPAGEKCDGTFSLSAGEYTLLCNIVEEEAGGKVEAHLREGMKTTFTVTR